MPMAMSLLSVIPWLVFCTISVVFTFAYHHYSLLVWAVVGMWAIMAFMFMAIKNRIKGSWFFFVGLLCGFACMFGCLCGLYNYYTHMMQYWTYDENRAYSNVLPTEPAEAHADAGKIVFAKTARVDTTRTVGYKASTVYCVAPILDDTQMDRVEYWAAGVDCCESRGDFNCDDSWDPQARSGVVIIDSTDLITTRNDYYMKAVREAQAAFSLHGSDEPLFVRWVSDPQRIQDDFWRMGIGYLFANVSIYLLVSIILGAMIAMLSKRKANSEAPRSARS